MLEVSKHPGRMFGEHQSNKFELCKNHMEANPNELNLSITNLKFKLNLG